MNRAIMNLKERARAEMSLIPSTFSLGQRVSVKSSEVERRRGTYTYSRPQDT